MSEDKEVVLIETKNFTYKGVTDLSGLLTDADTWSPEICWYCEEPTSENGGAINHCFVREIDRKWTNAGKEISYEEVWVTIPRCARCEDAHRKRKFSKFISAVWLILGIVVSIWLGFKTENQAPVVFGGIVVSMVIFILSSYLLPNIIIQKNKIIKGKDMGEFEFPGIEKLNDAGFSRYLW